MRTKLSNTLRGSDKHCEEYVTPDGSTLLLLQHGGRALGLFAPGSDQNFYWTHPSLDSAESARAFYSSAGWHNSGGDRTWVSPEVDVFFPAFPRTDLYSVPPQLDPGNYEIIRMEGGVRLVNRFDLTLSRSRQKLELEVTKSWTPALNPLRYETSLKEELASVEFAGYTQQTSLRLLGPTVPTSAEVGLWNLLQLPHGGEMLVSTYSRSEPKVYFGSVASEDLTVHDHSVRFRMHGSGIKKIGVRAAAATGRMGYAYQMGAQWSLVVRNFPVGPSGEYIDVPWNESGLTGARGYVTVKSIAS